MRSTPSDYENEVCIARPVTFLSTPETPCLDIWRVKKTTQGINPLLAKAPIFANHIFQPGSTPSSARLQILEGLFFLTGSEYLGWDPCVGAAAPPNTTLLLHGVEVHHPLAKTEEEAGGGRSAFNECGVKSGVRGWNWNKKKMLIIINNHYKEMKKAKVSLQSN